MPELNTDYDVSPRNLPVLLNLVHSLEKAQAQSLAVYDNVIEDGYPIPPDVHASLIQSLCRIQAALDQSLTL